MGLGLDARVAVLLRHSFATASLDAGYDIRTPRELLGRRDVRTTMIYTHVLNRGDWGGARWMLAREPGGDERKGRR